MTERFIQQALQREREAEAAERTKLLADREIRSVQAPALWGTVRLAIQKRVSDFQAHNPMVLSFDDISEDEVRVRHIQKRISVSLRYDRRLPCLIVDDGAQEDVLTFHVMNDSTVMLAQQNAIMRIDDLVTAILVHFKKR